MPAYIQQMPLLHELYQIKQYRIIAILLFVFSSSALPGGLKKLTAINLEKRTPFDYNKFAATNCKQKSKGGHYKVNDIHSLSHSKWNCKYHIVFAPKYRRKVFYGQKRSEIGQILRQLCTWYGANLLEAEACPDHIHILVEIPPKNAVSSFMGYLKGKSSIMIYNKWGNMKYKYRDRSFWCRGYYVDTVGKNTKAITEYIQRQLEEDRMACQLTFDDSDPFNG